MKLTPCRAHAGFIEQSARRPRISGAALDNALAELTNYDFSIDTDDEDEDRAEDGNETSGEV
jgi:hypothetical protein